VRAVAGQVCACGHARDPILRGKGISRELGSD
jgi:hypothetical protein